MSTIRLTLPSDLRFLGVPDVVLMEIGSEMECCRSGLEDLGSAVIEACTNAMEHGNGLDAAKTVEVVIELEDRKLAVTVLDQGSGFDYGNWQPPQDPMRPRGRGIIIMREFSDDLQFGHHRDGRFMIRLTKTLDPSADQDPADDAATEAS